MAYLPRNLSIRLARVFSASRLFKMQSPVFLPFYHVVSNEPLAHIQNYPYRSSKTFEHELDYILKYFEPVSLDELLQNPQSTKPIFHLSFDDGLRECKEVIAPILLRKGIPATFFVNTGFIDNKDLFHRYKASLILKELSEFPDSQAEQLLNKNGISRSNLLQTPQSKVEILDEAAEMMEIDFSEFLAKYQPYMTTADLKDLQKKGFSIGGHSHDHPEFQLLKTKKQFKQVQKSMDWLEENIKPKIKAFSFPFTDDGVKKKLLKQLDNQNICDITFGTAGLKNDAFPSHFQRVPMEQKHQIENFLKGEFLYYKLRKSIGKATVKH